jgi:predicted signal transduction protein with EAL and GGDEF domain
LRQYFGDLAQGVGVFRTAGTRPPTEMMVAFVDQHRDAFGVESMRRLLPIARSTYFRRRAQHANPSQRSARAQRDEALKAIIRHLWTAHHQVYGRWDTRSGTSCCSSSPSACSRVYARPTRSAEVRHADDAASCSANTTTNSSPPTRMLVKHADVAVSILDNLRHLGVLQIAVDDFGTGYSSLSYLKRFAVDALKIDRSFVWLIATTTDDTPLVTAVISLRNSVKLRVVAEGVETQDELAFLQAHGCEEAQGYYFSRPVPPDHCAQLPKGGSAPSETLVHVTER